MLYVSLVEVIGRLFSYVVFSVGDGGSIDASNYIRSASRSKKTILLLHYCLLWRHAHEVNPKLCKFKGSF